MYYNIEIVTVNGETTQAIYARETPTEAIKAFHGTLNYNIGLEGCEKVTAMVISDDGVVCKCETWRKYDNGGDN